MALSPRRLLLCGSVLTTLGLVIAMTRPFMGTARHDRPTSQEIVGGVIVLVGWATLSWGIHRFGRAG